MDSTTVLNTAEILATEETDNISTLKSDNNEIDQKSENGFQKHDLVSGPKRKAAVLLAYCGEKYYGLQMNRGDRSLRTIEGEFFKAVVDAKVVSPDCLQEPSKMGYRCASRTDKGVSTCGQVVSLRMRINEDVVALINKQLPPDIRVLAVKRATKGYSAQHQADARTYSYTTPTYAFADPDHADHSYRISDEKLQAVDAMLQRYKGTHSFHNFTSGKTMQEMSSNRYIMEFFREQPFVHENLEFVTLKIKGQSFMIHQIRKMVGLVMAIVSGRASGEHFERTFTHPRVDVPKAPGLGLVLERVHYDAYNAKHGHLHGGVDFSDCDQLATQFRMDKILPYIYKQEIECDNMSSWLETLKHHDFESSTLTHRDRQHTKCVANKTEAEKVESSGAHVDSTASDSNGVEESASRDVTPQHALSDDDTANCEAGEPVAKKARTVVVEDETKAALLENGETNGS